MSWVSNKIQLNFTRSKSQGQKFENMYHMWHFMYFKAKFQKITVKVKI